MVIIDPPTYDEVIEDVQEIVDEYLSTLDEIIESLTEEDC
jgi:hypothetical protein